MFKQSLGALALVAAMSLPLVASAQTNPAPGFTPGASAPAARVPGAQHRRRPGDPYMRAMRGLNLSDSQKQQIMGFVKSSRDSLRRQIDGVLTDQQRAQLRTNLTRERRHIEQTGGRPPAGKTQ